MEQREMSEIISEMNLFGVAIVALQHIKAETFKLSTEDILKSGIDLKYTYDINKIKKFYDTDAEYKEVVDTARFEQARLIEQTRNKLLEVYKKKVNALAKELAGVQ